MARAAADRTAGTPAVHRRHRPEETVLYQTLERYWPEFRERAEEAGGLPAFVVREVEAYLRCGRLEHGCLHLVCEHCGHSRLVAFSCKRRGYAERWNMLSNAKHEARAAIGLGNNFA
jgi:hypothetical protein